MLAAIVLAALTAFTGIAQTGVDDSTRVRGTVTGGAELRAAPHAWVLASSESDVRLTRADAHGRFVFLTLLPGVYRIRAYPTTRALVAIGSVSGAEGCPTDPVDDVELVAGVEYVVNVDLVTACR